MVAVYQRKRHLLTIIEIARADIAMIGYGGVQKQVIRLLESQRPHPSLLGGEQDWMASTYKKQP